MAPNVRHNSTQYATANHLSVIRRYFSEFQDAMIKWNDPDSRKTCEVLLLALGEFDPSLERPLLLKITDYVQCLDNVKELAVAILEETHVASHLLHFPTNALWKPVVRSIWAPSWTGYQTELRQLRYAYNTYLKLHVALAKDWIKPFDAISESQWKCSKDGADKLRVSILTSITRVYAHLPGISADILARVVDQLDQLISLSNSSSRNESHGHTSQSAAASLAHVPISRRYLYNTLRSL